MVVEKQYLEVIKRTLACAESGTDVCVVGMYDCGKNYTFDLVPKYVPLKSAVRLIGFGVLRGDDETILRTISSAITVLDPDAEELRTWGDVKTWLGSRAKIEKICVLINIGFGATIPDGWLGVWNDLKEDFSDNFCVQIYANVYLLKDVSDEDGLFGKLLLGAERIIIRPLDKDDIEITLGDYEAKSDKNVVGVREKMLRDSGGSPGILKSLFMQYLNNPQIEDWSLRDGNITYRLDSIVGELSEMDRRVLIGADKDETSLQFLKDYGYLDGESKCFSNVLKRYIEEQENGIDIDIVLAKNLTVSEKRVFVLLKKQSGKICTREEIAESVWGKNWFERFSDWALDQIMSQLRRKLVKVEKFGQLITKRGEGYYIES